MNTDTAIRANRTLHILFYGSDRLSAYWSRIEEMRECPGNNAGLIRERYLKMCNYMKMLTGRGRHLCGVKDFV